MSPCRRFSDPVPAAWVVAQTGHLEYFSDYKINIYSLEVINSLFTFICLFIHLFAIGGVSYYVAWTGLEFLGSSEALASAS